MKTLAPVLLMAALAAAPAFAADLDVKASDTVESVLAAQKGKRVTVRTRSGLEVSGTVKAVTPKLVQIAQLQGKEFYDAVVPVEAIDAVVVRTKD